MRKNLDELMESFYSLFLDGVDPRKSRPHKNKQQVEALRHIVDSADKLCQMVNVAIRYNPEAIKQVAATRTTWPVRYYGTAAEVSDASGTRSRQWTERIERRVREIELGANATHGAVLKLDLFTEYILEKLEEFNIIRADPEFGEGLGRGNFKMPAVLGAMGYSEKVYYCWHELDHIFQVEVRSLDELTKKNADEWLDVMLRRDMCLRERPLKYVELKDIFESDFFNFLKKEKRLDLSKRLKKFEDWTRESKSGRKCYNLLLAKIKADKYPLQLTDLESFVELKQKFLIKFGRAVDKVFSDYEKRDLNGDESSSEKLVDDFQNVVSGTHLYGLEWGVVFEPLKYRMMKIVDSKGV